MQTFTNKIIIYEQTKWKRGREGWEREVERESGYHEENKTVREGERKKYILTLYF